MNAPHSCDDDDGGEYGTFAVIDTVTELLLHMYLACVSLSSIVYIETRKRAEWWKTIQFLEENLLATS